jgi:hypothetical protein
MQGPQKETNEIEPESALGTSSPEEAGTLRRVWGARVLSNRNRHRPVRELVRELQFPNPGYHRDYLDFDRTAYLLYSTNAAASAHTKI